MAITPDQLMAPVGELEVSLFPSETSGDVAARLQVYIDDAATRIAPLNLTAQEQDDATRAWAYHRAYKAVHQRLLATPSAATAEEGGSYTISAEQLRQIGQLSEKYGQEFLLYFPDPALTSRPQSHAVRNNFSF